MTTKDSTHRGTFVRGGLLLAILFGVGYAIGAIVLVGYTLTREQPMVIGAIAGFICGAYIVGLIDRHFGILSQLGLTEEQ